MIYKGSGFLAIVWFGSSPIPPSPVNKLSLFLSVPVCRRSKPSNLLTEGVGEERESLVLYDSFNTLCFKCSTKRQLSGRSRAMRRSMVLEDFRQKARTIFSPHEPAFPQKCLLIRTFNKTHCCQDHAGTRSPMQGRLWWITGGICWEKVWSIRVLWQHPPPPPQHNNPPMQVVSVTN